MHLSNRTVLVQAGKLALRCMLALSFLSIGLKSIAATTVADQPNVLAPIATNFDSDAETIHQADSLYWQGKYDEALPLYAKLANTKKSKVICESSENLHRMADLADCYCRLDQYDKAQELYERILVSRIKRYGEDSLEIATNLTDISACYYYQDKYKKAQELCEKALKILDKTDSANPDIVAKICLELGQIYYAQSSYADASKNYGRAAELYDQSKGDVLEQLLLALEGGSACFYHDKNYKEALPMLKRIADIECAIHGNHDVRYGWALLNLSEVNKKLNNLAEAERDYQMCVHIFRRVNLDRIVDEEKSKGILTDEIKNSLYQYLYGSMDAKKRAALDAELAKPRKAVGILQCTASPQSVAKIGPWDLVTTDKIDPPVWMWMDPHVSQTAIVVCVHGLGLNARSYEAFAKKIASKGFSVVALDVRGFGAYVSSKGKEKVDFEGSLDDIATVLHGMRENRPGVPIFILGESMGGAIALQFTAKHPDLVNGLICAVPAGERYKSRKTDVEVAIRLVKNKNQPFDIGKQIINQATDKASLKTAWESDPFNRMELSPTELIEFQLFMNQNKSAAAKIKNTPVIFFQGGQDKLVKAEGTVQIFKEIPTEDKDLLLIGSSEHLIFEEGQFKPAVLAGVVGWMLGHMPDPKITAIK